MDDTLIFTILCSGISAVLFLFAFVCANLIKMFGTASVKKAMKYSWLTALAFLVLAVILYSFY